MTGGLQRSYSCVRVALAAGLLAGGATLMPAAAADLGGNCCADLEERVAELEATTARKGNRKVSLTISGQVSTAVMFWDDGHRSDTYVVDNTVSRTGFQFDGTARINPNLTAGFQLVIGISTGARSHMVSQKDDDAAQKTKLTTRDRQEEEATLAIELANWYLDHKHFGRAGGRARRHGRRRHHHRRPRRRRRDRQRRDRRVAAGLLRGWQHQRGPMSSVAARSAGRAKPRQRHHLQHAEPAWLPRLGVLGRERHVGCGPALRRGVAWLPRGSGDRLHQQSRRARTSSRLKRPGMVVRSPTKWQGLRQHHARGVRPVSHRRLREPGQ